MAVKSIYVKDEDVILWDKAKDLAGESLSQLLTNYIKSFIQEKENLISGTEKIILRYKENGELAVAKSFYGKWIIPPFFPVREKVFYDFIDEVDNYAVAVTAKHGIAVFKFTSQPDENDNYDWGKLYVFQNISQLKLSSEISIDLINTILQKIGAVEIEELDI